MSHKIHSATAFSDVYFYWNVYHGRNFSGHTEIIIIILKHNEIFVEILLQQIKFWVWYYALAGAPIHIFTLWIHITHTQTRVLTLFYFFVPRNLNHTQRIWIVHTHILYILLYIETCCFTKLWFRHILWNA